MPEIKGKGVTRTKAFNLKCKLIIHVSADYFKKEQAAVPGRMADIDWMAGIAVILQETEVFRARSIAMPALGTGLYAGFCVVVYRDVTASGISLTKIQNCKGK